jgi:guanine deaminase
MRLDEPLGRGIRVGLGTDVGAGRSFSLRRIAASAYDTAALTGARCGAESLLWLATAGGAHALGVGDRVGRLAVGYEADVVAIDLPDHDPRGGDGLFEALAFRHDAGPVAATYVRGRRITPPLASSTPHRPTPARDP